MMSLSLHLRHLFGVHNEVRFSTLTLMCNFPFPRGVGRLGLRAACRKGSKPYAYAHAVAVCCVIALFFAQEKYLGKHSRIRHSHAAVGCVEVGRKGNLRARCEVMHVCMCVYVRTYVCVYLCVCVYVCMYLYICICLHVFACMYVMRNTAIFIL